VGIDVQSVGKMGGLNRSSIVYFAASLAVVAIAGCARAPARPPLPDAAGAVAAIRALGARYASNSSVQVHPLRDPSLDGLLASAHAQEGAGHFRAARAKVDAALRIAPRAPDLLQYAAELAIETGDWKAAGALAKQSYDSGPKVGDLCARSLETRARSLVVQGDAAAAAAARAKIPACGVPPVPRF
jgi:tetratricopeptide (TPR) repeat protein